MTRIKGPMADSTIALGSERWARFADRVLAGEQLSVQEALSVVHCADVELLELLGAAYRVRHHYYGNTVKLNYLVNARSGACPEDCGYCSQSRDSTAPITKYPLMNTDEIVAGAERAIARNASTCCIVASGRGPRDRDVERVADAVRTIKESHPGLKICACLGILADDQAEVLRSAGVDRYNHNLNTGESHHDAIVSTHTYQDRVATVERAKSAGISSCSGIIVGMGEADSQLVEAAFALRDLDVDSIPVNFLLPIEGTQMQDLGGELNPRASLKVLAMFRFVCPTKELRISAGREVHLRHLQPMALYAANSLFVSDYLTEPGQAESLDFEMIEDLGFEIEPSTGDRAGHVSTASDSKR